MFAFSSEKKRGPYLPFAWPNACNGRFTFPWGGPPTHTNHQQQLQLQLLLVGAEWARSQTDVDFRSGDRPHEEASTGNTRTLDRSCESWNIYFEKIGRSKRREKKLEGCPATVQAAA